MLKKFIKNYRKNLEIFQKFFSIKIKKKKKNLKNLQKKTKKIPIKTFEGWQKFFFSNQIKNKYKLIFNQNKKKKFFFWDLN